MMSANWRSVFRKYQTPEISSSKATPMETARPGR
jgi:hypothetical protein